MFLEDTQIDLPYSVDAVARRRSVHGFTDQGVSLCVGDTLASPSDFFHIDDYSDHAQPESGSRFEHLAHCALSSAVSDNLRILGKIRQFGTISNTGVIRRSTRLSRCGIGRNGAVIALS